ncbi:unnamed protein product, partial [Coregonus sp. 'balchen']
ALYPDGTSDRLKQDDSVTPGASYTYRWEVRPEFSPTEGDAACLTWVYHSHVEAPRDITAGLIGALLTCKKDRDVVLMFNVVDESMSWYQEHNIQTFCSDPASVDPDDPDFQESNMMHGLPAPHIGSTPPPGLPHRDTPSSQFAPHTCPPLAPTPLPQTHSNSSYNTVAFSS